MKVNEGEVPQYYVEHSHEPIITPEEFDKVQTELARRNRINRQYSGKSIFSSCIVCGGLRLLLRLESLELDLKIPQGHLAMQRQIQG